MSEFVILRKLGKSIWAVLPEVPGKSKNECLAYDEDMRQHSVKLGTMMFTSRPASKSEYRPLLKEIQKLYPGAKVIQKNTELNDERREQRRKLQEGRSELRPGNSGQGGRGQTEDAVGESPSTSGVE